MQYQDIFRQIKALLSSPAKAWEEIVHLDIRAVYSDFVYPMIGFCCLSVFVGTLFSYGWSSPESFQKALSSCCEVAVALFGGFFMAAYGINQIGIRLLKLPDNLPLARQFTGYALVVPFLIQFISGLFPDFSVPGIVLQLYVVFIVWEGAAVLMKVQENNRLLFTVLSTILLIFSPSVIKSTFHYLISTFILNG